MTRPLSPPALARNRSGAFRMVALLASGALLGKILGFARELLMARVFGASLVADSFRGAGTAVLMPLTPLQGEGVPAVMIPMHRAWQEQGKAPEHFAALCAGLTAIAVLIALAIEASGSWWVTLVMGRMEPEGQAIALTFIRVMAGWMPASVLLNCLAAAEIATGRSRIAALRPTVLNASVMTGIVLYAVTGKLLFLPVLFALSFNVLGIWGVWTLGREGALDPKGLRVDLIRRVLREFFGRLRPLMAQPLAEQGQVWLERIVASGFAVGTIASIDYARTLTDSAALLIAQPIGMAVLYNGISANPRAAALAIAGPLLAVTVPASVFLAVFAKDIVTLIFARGAFDETAVMLTSGALRGIAIGLWATALGMILLRFLNNAGRNSRAALILASAFVANAALNLLAWRLIGPLGNGTILIGFGEAARGLVLLAGTAVALGTLRPLLRLALLCAPLAAVMAALCIAIQEAWTGLWTHLLAGGVVCFATALVGVWLFGPGNIAAWRSHLAGVPE